MSNCKRCKSQCIWAWNAGCCHKPFEAGCRIFCVARLEEAIELRSILASDNNTSELAEIICFDGLQDGGLADYRAHNLIPALKQLSEIEDANKFARKSGEMLPVWIQLDTGMNRLGISEAELSSLSIGIKSVSLSGLDIRAVMSHLSSSDNPSHHTNEQHHARFTQMSTQFAPCLALYLQVTVFCFQTNFILISHVQALHFTAIAIILLLSLDASPY